MKQCIVYCLCAFLVVSCMVGTTRGGGAVKSENRSLEGFNEIAIHGSTDAFISQSHEYQVELKAYENLLPELETSVRNSVLSVGYKPNSSIHNDNSELFVNVPELVGVSMNGSGNINISGNFTTQNFTASMSGSGNINLPEGQIENLKVEINGSGELDGHQFKAHNAEVTIKGSGEVRVYVTGHLNIKIKGSGDVYYIGDPREVTTDVSGSGKVIKE